MAANHLFRGCLSGSRTSRFDLRRASCEERFGLAIEGEVRGPEGSQPELPLSERLSLHAEFGALRVPADE